MIDLGGLGRASSRHGTWLGPPRMSLPEMSRAGRRNRPRTFVEQTLRQTLSLVDSMIRPLTFLLCLVQGSDGKKVSEADEPTRGGSVCFLRSVQSGQRRGVIVYSDPVGDGERRQKRGRGRGSARTWTDQVPPSWRWVPAACRTGNAGRHIPMLPRKKPTMCEHDPLAREAKVSGSSRDDRLTRRMYAAWARDRGLVRPRDQGRQCASTVTSRPNICRELPMQPNSATVFTLRPMPIFLSHSQGTKMGHGVERGGWQPFLPLYVRSMYDDPAHPRAVQHGSMTKDAKNSSRLFKGPSCAAWCRRPLRHPASFRSGQEGSRLSTQCRKGRSGSSFISGHRCGAYSSPGSMEVCHGRRLVPRAVATCHHP